MKISKISLSILILLIGFQTVKALGVTQPILEKEKMIIGESSRFYFEIQTVGYSDKQSCFWSVGGLDPLNVTFDGTSAIVDPGGVKKIYGTVSVPQGTPQKTYNGALTVSCEPNMEMNGGSAIKRTNKVPFIVSVVEALEERPEQKLPEAEKQKPAINLLLMLAIIILVILVICFVYWFKNKKK